MSISVFTRFVNVLHDCFWSLEVWVACISLLLVWQMIVRKSFLVIMFEWLLGNVLAGQIPGIGHQPRDPMGKQSWQTQLVDKNVGVYCLQGRRDHMEDRFDILRDDRYSFYAIYDGHGGESTVEYVKKTLLKNLQKVMKRADADKEQKGDGGDDADENKADMWETITDVFRAIDDDINTALASSVDMSGSTALVVIHDHKLNSLTVCNVGDCRAVLYSPPQRGDDLLRPLPDSSNQLIALSVDHKPDLMSEKQRIEASGGFIMFQGVWRLMGILATSRAFGDFALKETGTLIVDPEIKSFVLNSTSKDDLTSQLNMSISATEDSPERPWVVLPGQFMILATDGVWDVFSSEEAVSFVAARLHEPDFGAKSLVLQAFYRGSLDNISVMVVLLNTDIDQLKKLYDRLDPTSETDTATPNGSVRDAEEDDEDEDEEEETEDDSDESDIVYEKLEEEPSESCEGENVREDNDKSSQGTDPNESNSVDVPQKVENLSGNKEIKVDHQILDVMDHPTPDTFQTQQIEDLSADIDKPTSELTETVDLSATKDEL